MRNWPAIPSCFRSRSARGWIPVLLLSVGCFAQRVDAADEPLDSWTTARAKIAIATSRAGIVRDVWVDVMQGRATLAGKVPLSTDVSKIVSAVEKVEGVREVRSLLESAEYVPPQVDEAEVLVQVKESLGDGPLRLEGVSNGIVQIGGSAPSLLDQVGAFQKLVQIDGVRGIDSTVKPPDALYTKETREKWIELGRKGESMPGPYQDLWLTGAVKLRFAGHPKVPARTIHVDTRDSVVMLFGVVPNQEARAAAGRQAEVVDRVGRVENQIQVDPRIEIAAAKADDPKTEAEVKEALKEYGPLSSMQTTVTVKNGVATLKGVAKTDEHALAAALLARSVDGVRAVRNELAVER